MERYINHGSFFFLFLDSFSIETKHVYCIEILNARRSSGTQRNRNSRKQNSIHSYFVFAGLYETSDTFRAKRMVVGEVYCKQLSRLESGVKTLRTKRPSFPQQKTSSSLKRHTILYGNVDAEETEEIRKNESPSPFNDFSSPHWFLIRLGVRRVI